MPTFDILPKNLRFLRYSHDFCFIDGGFPFILSTYVTYITTI
jgi:hypothetical protein